MTEEIIKYDSSKKLFDRELEENAIWFNGDPTTLEYFFKVVYPKYLNNVESSVRTYTNSETFWKNVGGTIPRIHSGLPSLISKTWKRLIKPRSMKFELDDKAEEELLKLILADNDFVTLTSKGIVTESWGGYFVFKISHDEDISQYPIIEVVDPRDVEVEIVRKRVKAIIFKIYTVVDDTDIIIRERYELYKGIFKVSYKAYKKKENGDEILITKPSGYEDKTLPIDFIPAYIKNNTTYNSRFPNSIFGESDYSSVQSLFHMLDSNLSNTELEIDNAKAVKFVSESIVKKDAQGNGSYDNNETVIELPLSEVQNENFDIKKLITLLQPLVRVTEFNATAKDITGRILANVGLSPVSVGLPGFESIDAAADSQRARKETSIISRDEKVEIWSEFLIDFFNGLLKYYHAVFGGTQKDNIIKVEFDKYGSPSFEDLVDTVVKAKQGGIMSVKQAVDKLYPELDEENRKRVVLDIKGESFTPFLESDVE